MLGAGAVTGRRRLSKMKAGDPDGAQRSCSISDETATKRWQVSDDPSVMTPLQDRRRKYGIAAGAFGPAGKRRLTPVRLARGEGKAVLLAAATLLLPAAANAGPAVGSVSSGSVEISVSVAPRYKVAPEAAVVAHFRPAVHSGRYCLATNLPAPTMPVVLVWSSSRRPGSPEAEAVLVPGQYTEIEPEAAAGVRPCGLVEDDSTSHAPGQAGRPAGRLLLVRPE